MVKPLIILAAGGTGGHMMPASALSDRLKAAGYPVMLVTDRRGDRLATGMKNIPRVVTNTASHMAGGILGKLKSLFSIVATFLFLRARFKAEKPAVVIGFGGYPSLSPLLAARTLAIPYIVHEQNAVLGRVNRLMAEGAGQIALSYPNTSRVPTKALSCLTGNPVRSDIAKLSNIAYSVPISQGYIRLLVLGGSQGARILSDVVPVAIAALDDTWRARIQVAHQARPEDVDRVTKIYQDSGIHADVSPFFEDVASRMARSQLVIARAGASTLAECATLGRPAILVPLKIAADDHQSANAQHHADAGGAWILKEADFTAKSLTELLSDLFDEDLAALRQASEGMRALSMAASAQNLTDQVIGLASKGAQE